MIKKRKKRKPLSHKIKRAKWKLKMALKPVATFATGGIKKVKSGVKAIGKELLSPDPTPEVKKKVYKTEQEYIDHRDMMRRGDEQYDKPENLMDLHPSEKAPYAKAKAEREAKEKADKLRYDKLNPKKSRLQKFLSI